MADPIALGVVLTADSSGFEAGTAASERSWTKLQGALGTITSTSSRVVDAFKNMGVTAPAELGKVASAADGAATGFARTQGALQELSTAAPRLASLAFGPVGIAIAAAAAIGMAAWALFKDDTFAVFGEVAGEAVTMSEAAGAAWTVAKDLAGDALKGIGEFAKATFGQLSEWWDAMPDDATDALGYLWDGFKAIWTKIGDLAKLTLEALVGLVGAGVQGMIAALPALWEAYKNVFTQIGKLGAAAWEALKSGSTEPLMAQLRESGRSMVTSLGDVGKAGSAAFVAALPPAFEQLKTMATAAIANVRKRWADAVVGIRDGTSDADGKPLATSAAGKAAADDLIRQQQALQDALTNLERAGIAARQALQTDALDRELRELQSMFTLRKISEEQYIADSARLQQQKVQETINGLAQERDAVAAALDRLIKQFVQLDAAGDSKGALKTQQAIAQVLTQQVALNTKIEQSTRELTSIDKDRLARLEAYTQKQADAEAAALDMVTQYRVRLAEAGAQRQFEIGLIGKTREQQEILRATHAAEVELQRLMNELRRIEVQITAELMREEGARPDVLRDLYRAQNVLFQEAADARTGITQAETDARDKINAESADKLEKGLADALVNGLMSGKGVANSLRDYFKQVLGNGLRTILTQALSGVGGMLSQILGGGGGAGGGILSSLLGGGSGGGGGGILSSLFGGGGGIGDMLGGGLASMFGMNLSAGFSGVFGGAAQLFSGTLGGMTELGLGFGEALSGSISALGGFGAAIGAAIPIIGGIIAIASMLGVFDDKTGIKIDNSVRDGNGRQDIITGSVFGNYDVSGDIANAVFDPLIKKEKDISQRIADAFMDDDAIARTRERLQQISSDATDWFGFDDEASGKVAIGKASKRFLQQRFGTVFDEIDAGVAAMIRGFEGDADALLNFLETTLVAKDALDALTDAVPGFTLSLSAMLGATDDQRNALATLGTLYKLEASDYVQFTRDALAASKLTLGESLAVQSTAVAAIAALQDGSLAKAQELAAAENQRLTMFANLMQLFDQAATQINGLFTNQAEQFRLATMTPDEKYNYFDTKAADTFALLKEATDPTRIADLAQQYSTLLASGFGLLSSEQQQQQGGNYATLADQANAIAQQRLAEAQAKAEAEATALSTNIQASITTAMQLVATQMQAAADKMAIAAETPTNVVVTGRVTVELDNNGTVQPVDVGIAGIQTRGSY